MMSVTRRTSFYLSVILLLLFSAFASAETFVTGAVEGVWTEAGSPYVCPHDSIYVPVGDTLSISGAVTVQFHGDSHFGIGGTLLVEGTAEDSIVFRGPTLIGSPGDWGGLRFYGDSHNSHMEYAVIMYGQYNIRTSSVAPVFEKMRLHAGRYGIVVQGSSPEFLNVTVSGQINNPEGSHSVFCDAGMPLFEDCVINHAHDDGDAMYFESGANPTVRRCRIYGHEVNGITMEATGNGRIEECFISGVDRGIYLHNANNILVYYNVIERTYSSGMFLQGGSNIDVLNNTIAYAGRPAGQIPVDLQNGVLISSNGQVNRFKNNIIYCSTGFGFNDTAGLAGFNADYNCIYLNDDGPYGNNTNPGSNDFLVDPGFVNPGASDYGLISSSVCIDSGDPFMQDPDNTRRDIGALFYNQNHAPFIEAYTPEDLLMPGYSWGDIVDFSVTATDPDQNALVYRWYYNDELVSNESSTQIRLFETGEIVVEVDDNLYGGLSTLTWLLDALPVDEDKDNLPQTFAIEKVYPNPFNPTTTVQISMDRSAPLTISVYDILGKEVYRNLSTPQAGLYKHTIDGRSWASGMYFLRASRGSEVLSSKILLVK